MVLIEAIIGPIAGLIHKIIPYLNKPPFVLFGACYPGNTAAGHMEQSQGYRKIVATRDRIPVTDASR